MRALRRATASALTIAMLLVGCSSKSDSSPTAVASNPAVVPVARDSMGYVVQVHNLAIGLERGTIPRPVISSTSQQVSRSVATSREVLGGMSDKLATDLAAAMEPYGRIAAELQSLGASPSGALPAARGAELAKADAAWKSAMEAIQRREKVALLDTLPPLQLPGSAGSIPPPAPSGSLVGKQVSGPTGK